MFKSLRNKFLILNMTIITILLLGAFSIVYIFTFNQIQHNVNLRLSRTISEFGAALQGGIHENGDMNRRMPPEQRKEEKALEQPAQLNLTFTLEADEDGNILNINSIFDIEKDVYEKIVAEAVQSEKNIDTVKTGDVIWAYRRWRPNDGKINITAMDISRERGLLQNLVVTFAYVSLIALFIIFLISLFFANRAIRPIELAWEKQNQFIEDASHELRTPLTTINTNADVLLSHPDSTIAEEEKWLYYIKDESERMTRLTNDLLCLIRLDNDKDSVQHQMFSISETVQTVILTMEAVLYEKNLTFSESIEDNINFCGNPDKIKQLIMILMDNAIKYTAERGKISVCLKKRDGKIMFSVANTGDPLSAEMREKIFDRFYRVDRSRARNSGGYGLGLAIAKTICMQHNGLITAESRDGENIFTVLL